MSWVNRTMIIPAGVQPLAQGLAAGLAGDAGAGMWVTGLSPTGAAPATHYVSTGMIDENFAAMLADADAMFAAAQAAGAPVTLAQCQALVNNSDVSDGTREVTDADGVVSIVAESPFDAFARLGLQMVHEAQP